MTKETPLKVIRQKCLDCSLSFKMVAYCPANGVHSSRCSLWLYRFGMRPETAAEKYGRHVVTPRLMPDSSVCLDDLPANAADWRPSSPGQSTADRTPESKHDLESNVAVGGHLNGG